MAESLSTERAGSNQPGRASFLDFVERHDAIEEELTDAQETVRSIRKRRKDLRKLIVAEGHPIDEFNRALRDAQRSGEEREAADRAYRQNMAWLGKPTGFQGNFDLLVQEGKDLALDMNERDLKRVEREGFDAGKTGDDARRNSYSPGTEAFARWHSGWLRGQGEKVMAEIKPADAPKRRGRPRGVKNQPRDAAPPGSNGADTAPPNDIARAQGKADGLAGHRDHAARWPSGEYGHADYALGHAEAENERWAGQRGIHADQAEMGPEAPEAA